LIVKNPARNFPEPDFSISNSGNAACGCQAGVIKFFRYGACSSMAERFTVDEEVEGSKPSRHPEKILIDLLSGFFNSKLFQKPSEWSFIILSGQRESNP
jgi:hypothetical protein